MSQQKYTDISYRGEAQSNLSINGVLTVLEKSFKLGEVTWKVLRIFVWSLEKVLEFHCFSRKVLEKTFKKYLIPFFCEHKGKLYLLIILYFYSGKATNFFLSLSLSLKSPWILYSHTCQHLRTLDDIITTHQNQCKTLSWEILWRYSFYAILKPRLSDV